MGAADLKAIYSAATEAEAESNLELKTLEMGWALCLDQQGLANTFEPRDPLFAFSADIRKVIYTTNAHASVNMTLRKGTRNHRIFPSDEAVYKVVYLAMRTIAKKWTMPIHDWKPALYRFVIEFAERVPQ